MAPPLSSTSFTSLWSFLGISKTSIQTTQKDEWLVYKFELPLEMSGNPIVWWTSNKAKYPKLYRIAVKFLSAQATEVLCERTPSISGNIWADLRDRSSP
jgi:hypothetical protein